MSFSVSITRCALLLGWVLAAAGCGAPEANPRAVEAERPGDVRPRVLVLGTSLTAGPGISPEETYPARLQEMADSAGYAVRVTNAGLSGETSAGALRRIDWLVREEASLILVETGANDMLRGLDPDSTRANLDRILERLGVQRPDARILLIGMRSLPNLGREYGESFERLYAELAEKHDVRLVPFLLEGVAGAPELNLADGIHPNAEGHAQIARHLWPAFEEELATILH